MKIFSKFRKPQPYTSLERGSSQKSLERPISLNIDATSESSLVVTPPIFKLNEDLLLHIFHLNTYTPETEDSDYTTFYPSTSSRPLVIALQTSQVCRAWHRTMINSPANWGSMIDMTILGASSDLWLKKVVKLAGESDLSVYGHVEQQSISFFNDFLGNNWHRVRRLDICLHPRLLGPSVDERPDILVLPDRPALILEKFLLRSSPSLVPDAPNSYHGPKIIAPSLRRYHAPILARVHREPWTSQLVGLTLFQPQLDATDICKALGTTIHLESLTILDVDGPITEVDWSKIHLPKLVRLDISGPVTQCVVFLQNIVSHPDCALLLRVKDPAEMVIPEQFDILLNLVKPYMVRFFDTHQPSRLTLDVGRNIFSVHSTKPTAMRYFAHPEARLSYQANSRRVLPDFLLVRENLMSTLISLIPKSLEAVVQLEINCDKRPRTDLESTPGFVRLMKSLSSVEVLDLTPNSFTILNSGGMAERADFLPLLNVVKLSAREFMGVSNSLPYTSCFPLDFVSFLSQRRLAGVPVETFELSDEKTGHLKYDWRFLDAIAGLKVVWRRQSQDFNYTCGSGEREKLNWWKLDPTTRMISLTSFCVY